MADDTESVLDSDITAEIVRLKDEGGVSWNEIARAVGLKKETARSRYRDVKQRGRPPQCRAIGLTPADLAPDEGEVVERAMRAYRRTDRLARVRKHQVIEFEHAPGALAFVADQHMGDEGVDYERALTEAQIIADTPGMYAGQVGDLFNNFIIGRLMQIRLGTRLSIPDEAVLARRYLGLLSEKWRIIVGGNHESWTELVSGIPYFREVVGSIAPGALYDDDQIDVTVKVGGTEYLGRVRHKWRGRSIYNDTHGIERAYKWDQERGAVWIWGVGAHTHSGGLIREFRAGGETGIAAVCGSYKRHDTYARQLGLPKANHSTAVVIVFDENGMIGFSDLARAAEYMRSVYR